MRFSKTNPPSNPKPKPKLKSLHHIEILQPASDNPPPRFRLDLDEKRSFSFGHTPLRSSSPTATEIVEPAGDSSSPRRRNYECRDRWKDEHLDFSNDPEIARDLFGNLLDQQDEPSFEREVLPLPYVECDKSNFNSSSWASSFTNSTLRPSISAFPPQSSHDFRKRSTSRERKRFPNVDRPATKPQTKKNKRNKWMLRGTSDPLFFGILRNSTGEIVRKEGDERVARETLEREETERLVREEEEN